ncbi:MAG TPA: Zn-dependent hydrolase [Gemmatimonadaceae bacterium]|nr:Zn-dependent hydrolase [Gemmatimonadaceae bacterium]
MMNRREFAGTLAATAAGLAIGRSGRTGGTSAPTINAARLNAHLKELSAFGANSQGGVSRVAYSEADAAGRAYIMRLMREAKLDVRVDAAGNIWGSRVGPDGALKPIVFGSHVDSVPEGGNYDGTVGSLSAIEVAQTLAESGTATRHPLQVVIWQNEEGGLYGSRAVSGQLEAVELSNRAWSGKTIAEGITFLGGDPARLTEARRARGDIAAYFELHIEQGGTLERDRVDIGVVEGIVGIKQWEVTVTGVQNHAGTTPMDQRHDALLSASRFVEMVNRVVRAEPGRQVGTVGRMQAFPGAPNVIPGRAVCTLELRDLNAAKIDRLYAAIAAEAKQIGAADGTAFTYQSLHENVPAPSDPRMRAIIEDAAHALGYTTKHLPSGAGHDAQAMAQLAPMGMIFIPSIGGISHSPKEYSTPDDVAHGASVLLGAVLRADAL